MSASRDGAATPAVSAAAAPDDAAPDTDRDQIAPELIPHDHVALHVPKRAPVLLATGLGMMMQSLDSTIANVALPHMQASLSATQDNVTWILTSYVLASAVALPLTGWLVDQVGSKRLLLTSVFLFTLASALCGAAQNLPQMVIFRVIQGLAGAFLLPLAQTILLDVSTPRERPRLMMLFTQLVMIAPIMGPVLGGYLTENLGWRWAFYINVPVGALCIFLLLVYMPATKTRKRPFDLFGWALVTVALAAMQLMLDRGGQLDWFESGEIVVYLVLLLCAGWMAVIHIGTARHPVFSRNIFMDRNFFVSLILTGFVGVVMMAMMALLPTLLQSLYGYPAVEAGLLLTPRGVGMLLSTALLGRYMARLDQRLLLFTGLALMGVSLLMMSGWGLTVPVSVIVATGVLQGFALSLTFVPLNIIGYATLPPALRTDAVSVSNLVRNMGASIGVAICTVMLSRGIQTNHAELGQRIDTGGLPVSLEQLEPLGPAREAALRMADGVVNQQAAMIAYDNDFLMIGVFCLVLLPLMLIVRKPPRLGAASGPGSGPASGNAAASAAAGAAH